MAQSVRLKLNGKPFEKHPPTPLQLKLKTFLQNSPKDDIFDRETLLKSVGISVTVLDRALHSDMAFFAQHSERMGSKLYYGSAAAIAELRRQTAE